MIGKKGALRRLLDKAAKKRALQRAKEKTGKQYAYTSLANALKDEHTRPYAPVLVESADDEAFEVLKDIIVALEYDDQKLNELFDSVKNGNESR